MTVQELIEILDEYPMDAQVCMLSGEHPFRAEYCAATAIGEFAGQHHVLILSQKIMDTE